jgi:transposase
MRFFLGLDIAKDSFYAVLLDGDGNLAQQRCFDNTEAGFARLVAWLPEPRETLALCEPTGVYGQRLQRAIGTVVGSLHEINAQTLRRFSFTQVCTKTDEADALGIAHAARTLELTRRDLLQQSRVFRDELRDNVALWLGEYDRLRSAIAALRNQIANLNHHVAPDARLVQEKRREDLNRLLAERKQVIARVQAAGRRFGGCQAELLESIPGIGPLTTATALAVIRDVSRFASADALKAYVGAYPRRRQSGTREGRSSMARHGNGLFRACLWNAARAAVIHKHPQNPFRALFDRLTAKGKLYGEAIGAVVRKLVQTIYGVLRSQTPFRYPINR